MFTLSARASTSRRHTPGLISSACALWVRIYLAPALAARRRARCEPPHSPLTSLQDALVVTAPGSGAEIIPFLKTWVNLPIAILFTIGYSQARPSALAVSQ